MQQLPNRVARGLLRSAARTASTAITQPDPGGSNTTIPLIFREANLSTGRFYLVVTAASGTGGLKLFVRAYDEYSNVIPLGDGGTAVTATGIYIYDINPEAASISGNVIGVLPRNWDVQITHADSSSYTYSLTFEGA